MRSGLRTGLLVLVGILLPLPLMWLFSSALLGNVVDAPRAHNPRLIPMLSQVEREGTLTYGRECRTDDDCDTRLRCLYSSISRTRFCVDSRCMTDKQCPEDQECQTYLAWNEKDLVKACTLPGSRKEGESCTPLTRRLDEGCERGLVCQGRCGRPCELGAPDACPDGYFCKHYEAGAVCQPTCEGRTCPEGQQCVSLWGGRSTCAKVHGQNCQSVPCPQGQQCRMDEFPQRQGEVWMDCTQRCTFTETAPCPEGYVCSNYRCDKACEADRPGACEEGFRCLDLPEFPRGCAPDVLVEQYTRSP